MMPKRSRAPLARQPPGHADLLADLDKPGCPVCRAARRSSEILLADILSESVNDPAVRARLRASHGFCAAHAAVAVRLAGADGQGIAMLYGDFLHHVRQEALAAARGAAPPPWRRWRRRAAAGGLDPHAPCRACEVSRDRAELSLELLAEAEPESDLGRAARQKDRGICLPHLAQGLGLARDRPQALRLLDLFLRGEQQIRDDLDEYLRKLDHRFSGEPKGREQGSWRRAVLWMTGAGPTAER